MYGFDLRVNRHCECSWFGLETGVTRLVDTSPKRFKKGDEVLIALHIGGHRFWSGRGQPPEYAPAQFGVYKAIYLGLEEQRHVFSVDAIPPELEFSQRTKPHSVTLNGSGFAWED